MKRRIFWLAAAGALSGGVAAVAAAYRDARLAAPPPTQLMVDRHGQFLGELDAGHAPIGYWPATPLPPRVVAALVAIEDQRFWTHGGVDLLATARALRSNLSAGRHVSGASTLAMQVARMQNPGPRSYPKKVMEALTAVFLIARHGREAVLAHYLRIAPYGNRVRGISFAARRYFDKPVGDLSFAEIAFLSAIPQSPSRMNPYHFRGRQRAIRRGEKILEALYERQVIDEVDLALAREQIAVMAVRPRPTRPAAALHAMHRARQSLQDEFRNPEAQVILHATLDLDLTERVRSQLDDAVYRLGPRGVENGAAVVLERDTAKVIAYVGSADYFDETRAGAIDFAATPRPSGSTLKPFVFAEALDRGVITPSSILDDLFRGPGGTENADRRFLGPMLPRTALANSRNVPAAHLVGAVGLGRTYDLLHQLALHDRERPAEHYGIGLALGLLPVRLLDLATAYRALADDGRHRPPSFFLREDRASPHLPERRVLSSASARRITRFLADPLARLPTFPRMGPAEYAFGVALKTGTSQGYRDAWTVLYTQRYVVGVWLGRADARPMRKVGGTTAAEVARTVLLELQPSDMLGLSDLPFPPPRGFEATSLCALSGARATPRCEQRFVEYFAPGEAPGHDCSVHVSRPLGEASRIYLDLPPRYATWAEREQLELRPDGPRIDLREPLRPRILRPRNGARVMRDPEVPTPSATLALIAEVDPRIETLLWYVDGVPVAAVAHPYAARWPLAPGEHTIVARADGLSSPPVRVIVDPSP